MLILKPNEFTDFTDPFGLFDQEIEPKTFLSVEDWTETNAVIQDGDGVEYNKGSGRRLPKFEVNIELSDKLSTYERSRYTFLELIGDVGGFNSAITLFPSLLLSFYSARMF